MRQLAVRGLDQSVARGAAYADIRLEHIHKQILSMRNGSFTGGDQDSRGVAVRVLIDGAWGFGSANEWTEASVDSAVEDAAANAHAAATVRRIPVELTPRPGTVAQYRTPIVRDPFDVSLEEKLDLLRQCDTAMQRDRIVARMGRFEFVTKDKYFANTEGSSIHQLITYSGAGIAAVAAGAKEMQIRSYPHCWQNGGQFATAGYELVTGLDFLAAAGPIASEAVELLDAEPCPAGEFDLVVDPTQLALVVHETCGHPTELDRVLGSETSLAGTSFLTTDRLGWYEYGSPAVNLTADATLPGGLGTFGFDDEGTPAGRVPLVQRGIFTGYLTSRETAALCSVPENGAMRADSWNRLPLIRMTNVNLEPGRGSLDSLLEDTNSGLYVSTIRSWSIDDRRLNFQFGPEFARQINHGRLGRLYKNPTFSGITPEFWGSCDAVCGPEEWAMWGFPTCGKGQPGQSGQVAHGTAPARFRRIKVGIT